MNNTDYVKIVQEVVGSCLESITKFINKAPCDKTFKCRITQKISNRHYKVLYCGDTLTVTSSILCNVGDYVWVCAPCNNWNELFVVSKS